MAALSRVEKHVSSPHHEEVVRAESVGVGVSYNCRAGASGRTLAINSWILLKYHSVHFTVPLSYLSSWIFRYLVAFGI